ncbi:gamma-glutamylcyclotransferase family protein [Marinimicrococcus flavescens]|uniref:Gamma-glutamylcyclotransferase n=1 Tax=Marinimicrococcus flavescens TaxID=3031815 RepID=A0AAP3XPN4_9PROT|nr:gamma-glutamylcyclotransferase [Marinimicrococcus flavescens]
MVPRAEASVWGVLWRLRPSDEERLDLFEGVAGGF